MFSSLKKISKNQYLIEKSLPDTKIIFNNFSTQHFKKAFVLLRVWFDLPFTECHVIVDKV